MIVIEIGRGGLIDIHTAAYRGAASLESAARLWAADHGSAPVSDDLTEIVVTNGSAVAAWNRSEIDEMRAEEWRRCCADMFNDY